MALSDGWPEDAPPQDGPATVAENEVLRSIGRRARTVNLTRAQRLGELLDQALLRRLAEDERGEAEGLAHQIIGSAGTFGYSAASELAVEVEDYLARPGPDADRLARAREAVAELVEQLSV